MHAKEKNQGECVCLSVAGTEVFNQDVLWNNRILLYSTGNYIQYPMINHYGKESVYICITGSLCCIVEINMTL